MTSELYLSLGHVTVLFGKSRIPAFDDWYMRRKKQQRRIEVVTGSFVTMPALIAGTNRIGTMHRRLAEKLAKRYPLKLLEVPFEIPPVRELAQWDIANNSDVCLRWVVSQLREIAEEETPGRFTDEPSDSTIAFEFQQEQTVR